MANDPKPLNTRKWEQQPYMVHISDILSVAFDEDVGLKELPPLPGDTARKPMVRKDGPAFDTVLYADSPFTTQGKTDLTELLTSHTALYTDENKAEIRAALEQQCPWLKEVALPKSISGLRGEHRLNALRGWVEEMETKHASWHRIVPLKKFQPKQAISTRSWFSNITDKEAGNLSRFSDNYAKVAQALVALSKLGPRGARILPEDIGVDSKEGTGPVLIIKSNSVEQTQNRLEYLQEHFAKAQLSPYIDIHNEQTESEGFVSFHDVIHIAVGKLIDDANGRRAERLMDYASRQVEKAQPLQRNARRVPHFSNVLREDARTLEKNYHYKIEQAIIALSLVNGRHGVISAQDISEPDAERIFIKCSSEQDMLSKHRALSEELTLARTQNAITLDPPQSTDSGKFSLILHVQKDSAYYQEALSRLMQRTKNAIAGTGHRDR